MTAASHESESQLLERQPVRGAARGAADQHGVRHIHEPTSAYLALLVALHDLATRRRPVVDEHWLWMKVKNVEYSQARDRHELFER